MISLLENVRVPDVFAVERSHVIRVVHCKKEHYDVYIGRPSKWGNPFRIGVDGTREDTLEKYHQWILTQPDLLRDLPELRGKVLGCWCGSKPCHGTILAKLADG